MKQEDEKIIQRAITLLLEHADEDFVSKKNALEAGTDLHNLMIRLRSEAPAIKSLDDCKNEVVHFRK